MFRQSSPFSKLSRIFNIVAPYVQHLVSMFWIKAPVVSNLRYIYIQKEKPSLNQQLHHVNLKLSLQFSHWRFASFCWHFTTYYNSSPRNTSFSNITSRLKVIPQYCTAHLLLRTVSHAISARALENGGFFFTAGPRHRGKSSFLRKRVWWPIIFFRCFELNNKFLYVK